MFTKKEKEVQKMAVSTPVGGRVKFTYMDGAPDMRISGISPIASAVSIADLGIALSDIQNANISNGFLYAEFELTEN